MGIAIFVLVKALINGGFLWFASKFTGDALGFLSALVVAMVAAACDQVPTVGWVLSIFVMFALLRKFTRSDIYPDLILLVLVSQLFSVMSGFGLLLMIVEL